MTSTREQVSAFRAMHQRGAGFILPNAWDGGSARMLEHAGFPVLATTSAGVAWALGYPDGQRVTRDEMLAVVAAIARHVRVPVTADLEAGYGLRPEDAAATARGFVLMRGGLPLVADGQVVGAIGVSADTPQHDEEIAKAGVAALK